MSTTTVLGLDLGGTKIAAGLYDCKTWEVLQSEKVPTPKDFATVQSELVRLAKEFIRPDTLGIGLGVPGLVEKNGIIRTLPNIPGAEGADLANVLRTATALPVTVENDANCFTVAQAAFGAGKGKSVVVGITLGTGVGGGIVIDGNIFRGGHGFAGEIGHMLLKPGEPPYETKDKRGEIEQFFSGTALGKRCEAAQSPNQYLDGETCSFLFPEVHREVAWMCASLTHLLDPDVIVFGGTVGRALKPHLAGITEDLRAWVLPGTPLPELVISELVASSTLGAAWIATRAAKDF